MAQNGSRWRVPDRRYRSGYRLTPEGRRARTKWAWLIIGWFAVIIVFPAIGNGVVPLIATVALIVYAAIRISANRRVTVEISSGPPPPPVAPIGMKWNPAPGWPVPPPDWFPPLGWQPPPDWPTPPADWEWWVPDFEAPIGERRTRRTIPQDIKIAVAARDQGRCRCTAYPCHGHAGRCNSATNLHYDHVIPWSGGGTDTIQNLQLLCGPCNLRKGADDIPVG